MPRKTVGVGAVGTAAAGNTIYTSGLSDCVAFAVVNNSNSKILYHINGGLVTGNDAKFTQIENFFFNNANAIRSIIIVYGANAGRPSGRDIFLGQGRVAAVLNNRQFQQATSSSVEVSDGGAFQTGI